MDREPWYRRLVAALAREKLARPSEGPDLTRARMCEQRAQWAEAISEYRRALEDHPDHIECLWQIGEIYRDRLDDQALYLTTLERVAELGEGAEPAWMVREARDRLARREEQGTEVVERATEVNMGAVHFDVDHERFGCLAPTSDHPVEMEGLAWPTLEHYVQAMAFPHDPVQKERIRSAVDAEGARRAALHPDSRPREDWGEARWEVMRLGLRAKVTQHPEVLEALLATGDEPVIYSRPAEPYWGDAGDGTGENALGELLTGIRAELRELGHS